MGVYQRGRKFWIAYSVSGKQYREPAGYKRKLAEQLLEQRRAEVVLGRFKAPSVRMRLEEYAPTFLEWSKSKKASWQRDRSSLIHLKRHLGRAYLDEIRHSRIEVYQQARRKERGRAGKPPMPATINKEIACLKKLLSLAVRDGVIDEHPARGAALLPEHNERNRVVSDGEAARLIEVAPEWFKPLIVVAVETGMRANELALLSWKEVDLKEGFIRLRSDQTKNSTARSIPLSPLARQALEGLPRPIRGGRVFLRRGKPLKNGDTISSAFRSVKRAAGLEDIWFHDFRRTRANRWRQAGHDYFRIMKATGHKTLSVFKRYNPIDDVELKALVDGAPADHTDTPSRKGKRGT